MPLMVTCPQEYLQKHIGKYVEIQTYNNRKIEGILSGFDVYVNMYIKNAKDINYIGDVIINGSNIIFCNLK